MALRNLENDPFRNRPKADIQKKYADGRTLKLTTCMALREAGGGCTFCVNERAIVVLHIHVNDSFKRGGDILTATHASSVKSNIGMEHGLHG